MASQDYDNLREKLNTMHTWPSTYLFKFIVKTQDQKAMILSIFDSDKDIVHIKASSKGTYHSISIHREVQSAEDIIALYTTASEIEGVIAL